MDPRFARLDLRQLRYFVAVAEAGHMTRAASALGIQQPPLSQQIKALETRLGMTLLHRHPKGVALSDGGRVFLDEARRLLADFAAMCERMQDLADGRRGQLAVGFTSSAAAHAVIPEVLRECRSKHPGLVLALSENNAAELTEAVAGNRLHVGFLRVPVAEPEGICFEPLFNEAAWLALPLDHRLARVPRATTTAVPLKALHGERLILVRRPGAPGLYANLLAACEAEGVRPVVAAEVERMMMNLNLVAAGAGISVVPASMCNVHAASVVYRPLPRKLGLGAPMTLVYRAADATGPTATLLALARQVARSYDRKTGVRHA